jgi:hypothetical protein
LVPRTALLVSKDVRIDYLERTSLRPSITTEGMAQVLPAKDLI